MTLTEAREIVKNVDSTEGMERFFKLTEIGLRKYLLAEGYIEGHKAALESEAVTTIRDLLNEHHGERCMHNGKPYPCEVCDAISAFDKLLEAQK